MRASVKQEQTKKIMNEITQTSHSIIEAVIAAGDLGKLTVDQRNTYYVTVCQSIGLNPLTRPFEYITLNGRLTLYARKDATDQLRAIKSVSITRCDVSMSDPDWIIVTVEARDAAGRTDIDIGAVSRKDMRGDLGNVIMKAVTKGKRRVTLSLCGLGMLDESEVETIPGAQPVVDAKPAAQIAATAQAPAKPVGNIADAAVRAELAAIGKRARQIYDSVELPDDQRIKLGQALVSARSAMGSDSTIDAMRAAIDTLKAATGIGE